MKPNALPLDDTSITRGMKASHRMTSRAMKHTLGKTIDGAMAQTSPSPFVVNRGLMDQYIRVHEALTEGLNAAVAQWYTDRRLQNIFDIHPKIASSLRVLKDFEYKIGCVRPDLLIDTDGMLNICEINARYPLNGVYLSSYATKALHEECMDSSSIYAELGFCAVSYTPRIIEDLSKRLCATDDHHHVDTIWIVTAGEPLHDLHVLEHSTGVNVRICHPDDLVCNGAPHIGLFVKESEKKVTEIRSCILQMRQHEFVQLSDDVLKAVTLLSAKGRTLNDLRTIFLVHDKRMLYVLRSGMLPLKAKTLSILQRHIIPTFVGSDVLQEFVQKRFPSLVLKPCLAGKGEGIIMEKHQNSREEFLELAVKAVKTSPHVLQPFLVQMPLEVMNQEGIVKPLSIVASLLSLDGVYYGPGLYRANDGDIVSLARGGVPIFPAWQVEQIPASTRSFASTLRTADFPKIMKSLIREGLAVVGVDERVGCRDALRYFLKVGLGAQTRRHSDVEGDVWDVKPRKNWTNNDARSHTSNPFEIHTDASFEATPPRFVAMSVIHADRHGGGFFSMARIADVVKQMKEEDVEALRTIKPKWKVPPEFKKSGEDDTLAPVLMSDSRARFRKDIVMTEHLSASDQKTFWTAFEKFCNVLEPACLNNEFVVPEQCVIVFDNHRFAHARTKVLDMNRHLHRVRFDLPTKAAELVN